MRRCSDRDGCRFEDFFNKYSKGQDGLTFRDVLDGLKGQRLIMDPIGWFGAFFECRCSGFVAMRMFSGHTYDNCHAGIATWILLWPEDGVMKKEDIRRVYDGSIFYDIAAKRAGTAKTKKKAA